MGERAAQIIARLPRAARFPNHDYMDAFFVSIVIRISNIKYMCFSSVSVDLALEFEYKNLYLMPQQTSSYAKACVLKACSNLRNILNK